MQSLFYSLNIGTLAAWLSLSGASTVAIYVKGNPGALPALKTHEQEEIHFTEGEIQEVETFAGGSAANNEVATENNEEILQNQEAATPEVLEVPEMPEVAEAEPLPDVPDLPEIKPEPLPKPDAISVPKPKATTARTSKTTAEKAKSGSDKPVARRTDSGSGSGQGSSGNGGAGAGDAGTARFAGGRTPKPTYPAAAKKDGIQGMVRASVTVDESGNVVNVSIVSSSNPIFNESVISTLRSQWRFKPGPRATRIVPINFKLK